MGKFLNFFFVIFGTTIFIVVGFFGLIVWRGIEETKFVCNGFYIDQHSPQKKNANSTFIFEKFAKFIVWTDQVGTVKFELHEPAVFRIFYVYKVTDHMYSLTEIGDKQKFLGSWSTISGKLIAKLSPDRTFEGYCKLSS